MGTVQSTLTNFRYLRPVWKENTEQERLLGVSLTGVMDHPMLQWTGMDSEFYLDQLRNCAVAVNKEVAAALGISRSAAITCVKPEGTVSQLTDTASGLHPRFAEYYIRRVRADKTDPLSGFMRVMGVPCEDDMMNANAYVFSFPMKAPEGARLVRDLSAIGQLEHWLMMQEYWCEHKPSITVYYSDDEFLAMCQWVWDNFDKVSGIAFLPRDNGTYQQAPYEEISKEQYEALMEQFPSMLHWDAFQENEDNTTGSQTLACVGSSCEVI